MLKQQQRQAAEAQRRLQAELDKEKGRQGKAEASLRQQLSEAQTQLAAEISRRDAARGVAAELHVQLEQKKEEFKAEQRP